MAARTIEYMPVADLPEAPRNPKAHAEDELTASMARFGYVEPIILDERTGRIVSGHGRKHELLRGQEAGETPPDGVLVADDGSWMAPVSRGWASKDDAEAEAFVIAANRIGERGGWHDDLLADVLVDLAKLDDGFVGVGYTGDDLSSLLESLGRDVDVSAHQRHVGPHDDDENVPPVPTEPVTVRGDVWLVGRHRVMCGDCRDADDVATLLNGATVNVAFTSPPYADRRKYDESSGFQPVPPDEYVAWFAPVAANVAAHLAEDGSWFVNIKPGADDLDRELYVYDLAIAHVREWGWHLGDEFCWERSGVPGQVTLRFKNQWESVFQFARQRWKMRPGNVRHLSHAAIIPAGEPATRRPGGKRSDRDARRERASGSFTRHQGDCDSTSIFATDPSEGLAYPGNRLPTFSGSHEALGHAAAFPVGLPSFFVKAYTDPGDVIYDPFLGSGSTLLAAHNEERVGYGMELSPAYVDVTLARWQRKTGVAPVRASTGEPVDFHTEG